MTENDDPRPVLRCAAVWAAVTALAGALVAGLRPVLAQATALPPSTALPHGRPATTLPDLLVTAAAVTLAGAILWLWVLSSLLTWGAARGRSTQLWGCPQWWRRSVLGACGLLLGAVPAAALADPSAGQPPAPAPATAVQGLPLPDLPATEAPVQEHRVVAGESLWSIAAGQLGADASTAEVDAHWRALWERNRDAIGPDPDLIRPGLHLHPPHRTEQP